AGRQVSPLLPDGPPMRERAYDAVIDSWIGLFVPVRTPAAVVSALSAACADASKSADMAESLAKFGSESAFQTPEQFAARVKADIERWGPVVKASGFIAED